MYYPHPLIARQMRQFPILRLPWRRYVTTSETVEKAYAKREYRKAERAYRLMARVMARAYQSPERGSTIGRVGQFVHTIWDAFNSSIRD